jgi:CRP-like cAMP-binding protein
MISPELLRRFTVFGGLAPEIYEEIAQFSDELTVDSDYYLFEEGDKAERLFLVLEGSVDLLINMNEEGTERNEVETIVTGQFIGWSSMLEPYVYKLSALTTSKSSIVVVDAAQLRDLLAKNPEAGFLVMSRVAKLIGERLTNMRMRLMSFSP